MNALVLVHAPIARPVRLHAVGAPFVRAAIEIREITADEILVRFGRAYRQRHEHVVLAFGDFRPVRHRRRGARQTGRRDAGVDRLRAAEHAPIFRAGR